MHSQANSVSSPGGPRQATPQGVCLCCLEEPAPAPQMRPWPAPPSPSLTPVVCAAPVRTAAVRGVSHQRIQFTLLPSSGVLTLGPTFHTFTFLWILKRVHVVPTVRTLNLYLCCGPADASSLSSQKEPSQVPSAVVLPACLCLWHVQV